MLDLAITCTGVTAPTDAATPTLRFALDVAERGAGTNGSRQVVRILALRCQVRIEPSRRTHEGSEVSRLQEVLGAGERWRDNLHPIQLAQVQVVAPAFSGRTTVDLDIAVPYDFEVATATYLEALAGGEVPFILLFSGSAFGERDGRLDVTPVSWSAEARTRMPLAVWRQAVDNCFPGTSYLRLRRDTIAALQRVKAARALPGWDATVQSLLAELATVEEAPT